MSLPKSITLMNYIDDVMLIGPNEQEVATTSDFARSHVKVFLLRWRISHCTWPLLPTRKKCWMLWHLVGLFLIWVCYPSLYSKWFGELLTLNEAWNRRGLFSRSRLLCRLLYPWAIWFSRISGTWGVDAVWSLWQTPRGEWQRDLWDFGARLYHHLQTTGLSLRDSFSLAVGPWWKLNIWQLATKLPCRPSFPSLAGWPLTHQVIIGCVQQKSIVKERWYICD